tara:strand:- start:134 stop:436 length:303 start_codon:yes stop_codon:yes gene_type:complete
MLKKTTDRYFERIKGAEELINSESSKGYTLMLLVHQPEYSNIGEQPSAMTLHFTRAQWESIHEDGAQVRDLEWEYDWKEEPIPDWDRANELEKEYELENA